MPDASAYILTALAFALNLPLGAWRTHHERFSVLWFLAIHVPIPLVIVLRLASGQGWRLIPVLVIAAVAGQLVGARLYSQWRARHAAQPAASPD
jgi:hypothetical protein